MTRDERLALRFDQSLAAARRAVGVADGVVRRDDPDPYLMVVNGKRDPELFMAWELMDHVTPVFNLTDNARRESIRATWTARDAAQHLGQNFWERLQVVLGPIIHAEAELRRVSLAKRAATGAASEPLEVEWTKINATLCPLRAKGLADARAAFGRQEFDRFLYEVVAPDAVVLSSSSSTSPQERASSDIWVEDGCQ
jgi:hypothetical protein